MSIETPQPGTATEDPYVRAVAAHEHGLEAIELEEVREEVGPVVHRGFVTSSRKHKLLVRAIQVGMLAAAIGLWQYMATGSETLYLSVGKPFDIVTWLGQFATNNPASHSRGWPDLGLTLQESVYGYFMGVGAGIILGAILGSTKWLRTFAQPFIAMANAFPKIVLAPLFILIFGSSLAMKSYFVAVGTFFITFYAVFNGVKSIDPVYLRNARILGAGRFWRIREVYFPAIIGWITAGLRLTAQWAITAAVVCEFLASNSGIGYVVNLGQQIGDLPEAWGGLIIIALVALIIDRILLMISRRFSAWRLV